MTRAYNAPIARERGAAAIMANVAENARKNREHDPDFHDAHEPDDEEPLFDYDAAKERVRGKKVACIGSGPSSLTCADELAREGVDVTVFEALHKVGGVLSYGIPEFRLPKRLVAREVATLEAHGVKFELNAVVGRLYDIPELMEDMGFDAVYIASGAGAPIYLGIPDEMYDGVMMANELLTRTNLMRAYEFPESATPLFMGRTCVVIGGGNVAMDAARTVRRFGADVTIVYRRSREELPAREEEVLHAEQEGIKFRFLTNPVEIIADDRGWVRRLDCVKMELGSPDLSGRRRPVEIPGSRFPMTVDMVVVAVGNRPNQLVQESTPGLAVDDRGRIRTDKEWHTTNIPGVFAGGDVTTGAATVIQAMGTGKEAARSILGYLGRL
ncbi:MAG: dihydropyrimidine dehydrogenase [Coriobacteriaceae bacterium]|nr:dihydropyrimidine dehydrogenase [Coriobacteriaceae bacterium]